MKKLSLLVIALCITCGSVSAQQALFGGQMPQSPEIHADKTVTFRCMAPGAVFLYDDGGWGKRYRPLERIYRA